MCLTQFTSQKTVISIDPKCSSICRSDQQTFTFGGMICAYVFTPNIRNNELYIISLAFKFPFSQQLR